MDPSPQETLGEEGEEIREQEECDIHRNCIRLPFCFPNTSVLFSYDRIFPISSCHWSKCALCMVCVQPLSLHLFMQERRLQRLGLALFI